MISYDIKSKYPAPLLAELMLLPGPPIPRSPLANDMVDCRRKGDNVPALSTAVYPLNPPAPVRFVPPSEVPKTSKAKKHVRRNKTF